MELFTATLAIVELFGVLGVVATPPVMLLFTEAKVI
jgi:predicted PurR-regulated permease PerM